MLGAQTEMFLPRAGFGVWLGFATADLYMNCTDSLKCYYTCMPAEPIGKNCYMIVALHLHCNFEFIVAEYYIHVFRSVSRTTSETFSFLTKSRALFVQYAIFKYAES